MSTKKLRVCILHPDLGIGGAERLIVDAAVGLQKQGHTVHIYTSYHDPSHAFEETTNGTLTVRYIKPPLPRHVFNALHIILAILRQIHLVLTLLILVYFGREQPYDVFLVDQLSACVPLLRWGMSRRVVFYCHFPDKLLADGTVAAVEGVKAAPKGRGGLKELVKRVYRVPVNWVEEVTTRQADVILANSQFTSRVFKHSFPSIKADPVVVYPGINITAYHALPPSDSPDIDMVKSDKITFLSLNRFERKKNAGLAIQAFGALPGATSDTMRLVLAGGYDPRLADNVECLAGLLKLCEEMGLGWEVVSPKGIPDIPTPAKNGATSTGKQVLFVLNFSNAQRTHLLTAPTTRALLYTPQNEHFGIVPVEAMVCGVPVVACDSGGPVESVVDPSNSKNTQAKKAKGNRGRTGYLLPPTPSLWTQALVSVLALSDQERKEMGDVARARVKEMFSLESLTAGMERALMQAVEMGEVRGVKPREVAVGMVGIGLGVWLVK